MAAAIQNNNMRQQAQLPNPAPAPSSSPITTTASNINFVSELKWYYAKLFPIQLMHEWLAYGQADTQVFAKREVSFTLSGDIYLRFRTFRNMNELHSALKERAPIKIDWGAVYNIPCKDRNTLSVPMVPVEKELVFDIDMTDYADVMCALKQGSEVEVTDANWGYMAVAVQVIDETLRVDFGFENIMFVYSGRRGLHVWVADHRARKLSNEGRSAIAEYLALKFESSSGEQRRSAALTKAFTPPLHPLLQRAKRNACEPFFRDFVLNEQKILEGPEQLRSVLAHIPDPNLADTIFEYLDKKPRMTAEEKWEYIKGELDANYRSCPGAADYILFRYTYPRLDINVSKEINHLLKSPFCVHPKTGRVCVPFRAEDAFGFTPGNDAPDLHELIEELNERSASGIDKTIEELHFQSQTSGTELKPNHKKASQRHTARLVKAIEVLYEFIEGMSEEREQYKKDAKEVAKQIKEEKAASEFLKGQ